MYVQSNPAVSNSVNLKSPLFRRKIEFPWIYPSPVISKPRYFEPFFHFPWGFEIAGFDCMCMYVYVHFVGGFFSFFVPLIPLGLIIIIVQHFPEKCGNAAM